MRIRDLTPERLHRAVPVLGALRIAFAVGMLVRPAAVSRTLGLPGDSAMAIRMAGGRELALGIGALEAWRRHQPVYGWIAAQAVSDAGDTLAFTLATRCGRLSRRRGSALIVIAAGGVLTEALVAYKLRQEQLQ